MPQEHDKSTGQFTSGEHVAKLVASGHKHARQGEVLKKKLFSGGAHGSPRGEKVTHGEMSGAVASAIAERQHDKFVGRLRKKSLLNPHDEDTKHLLAHHRDVANQTYNKVRKLSSIDGDESTVRFILTRGKAT